MESIKVKVVHYKNKKCINSNCGKLDLQEKIFYGFEYPLSLENLDVVQEDERLVFSNDKEYWDVFIIPGNDILKKLGLNVVCDSEIESEGDDDEDDIINYESDSTNDSDDY